MALKAIIDSLDDVDEAFRSQYTEKDGVFVLQVEGFAEHPEAKSLKNALDRVRGENRTVKAKVTELEGRLDGLPDDFDVEKYNDLVSRAEGSDPAKLDERLERQRQADEKKYNKDIGERDGKINKLTTTLNGVMVRGGLKSALIDAGVKKEYLDASVALLMQKGKIRLEEEDDGFHVYADNGIDEHTDLTKFVSEWAASDEGKVFVEKAQGSGANGGKGQKFDNNPFDAKTRNLTKQQELIRDNPERAKQMALAAGVTPNW